MAKSIFTLCVSLLFTCFLTKGQPAESKAKQVNMAAIDKLVKSEMDKQHIFGLSLAIVKNGKLVISKGYGLANLEHEIPATEQTAYKIGSVSKQMIATAIMSFVQANKLHLTDSLPAFFKNAPAAWNKITIRHLLNHTSGLPRESPIQDNMKEQPDSLLIRAAYDSKLLFEPGTSWRYCNLGYFMLADIIRQVSGQSFPDFMRDEIFGKFGLNNTQTTSTTAIVKNKADGYVYKSPGEVYKAQDYVALRPSGAFLSSIADLVKWEMLLQSDKLLNKQSREQMWKDKVKTSTSGSPMRYYGYGWDVNEHKGLQMVHHDGTLPGFASSYLRFIESDSAIIILTNADNAYPSTIAIGIADLVL